MLIEIRLLGAIIFLISLKGVKINFFLKNIDKKQQKRFFISILLGTNIGIFLQQVVFKTLPIGVGSVSYTHLTLPTKA